MSPTDERLMHDFYACNTLALDELAVRYDPLLATVALQILRVRTGSEMQARSEWDIDERLTNIWAHVHNTKGADFARWPHQRLTVLAWLLHLLTIELDRHLGFHPPF
jgi:hypothetical protein